MIDLERINQNIADRSDVFYWQTDRAVDPAEAGQIWADRHRYFTDDEIVECVNEALGDDKLASIEPLDPSAQTNLGNVNSVRSGQLLTGREVIVRCHPKGVANGYFYAESEASRRAKQAGIPSFDTLAVHEFTGGEDFAFQVIEKLSGTAVQKWLESHPDDEAKLVAKFGETMAKLHQIEVEGFGPFNNTLAKGGKLVGLHNAEVEAVRAGLPFNFSVLEEQGVLTPKQTENLGELFSANNPLLRSQRSVLVHNDYADWNLLTDGEEITGVLDWDECVAADPISDIACWSTFFDPSRLSGFLEGYFKVAEKPSDFQDKFELMRLRYILSKMTLRLRRYSWDPSDFVKGNIEKGKLHLAESLTYFGQ